MAETLTKDQIVVGWVVYVIIILVMLTLGILFDLWYSRKQNAIFENPPEYLIGENEFN